MYDFLRPKRCNVLSELILLVTGSLFNRHLRLLVSHSFKRKLTIHLAVFLKATFAGIV